MGYAARNRRKKVVDSLTLPEKTRVRLKGLWEQSQMAQAVVDKFQHAMITAVEMFGLDPTLNHGINWETGVITPAPAPTKPELVQPEPAEEAS